MAYRKPSRDAAGPCAAAVTLTTRAGTHTFTPRDRLWVSGVSGRETRPATTVRCGDLVAFLGRVVSVRRVAADSGSDAHDAERPGIPPAVDTGTDAAPSAESPLAGAPADRGAIELTAA